jgi:hypothetical protein
MNRPAAATFFASAMLFALASPGDAEAKRKKKSKQGQAEAADSLAGANIPGDDLSKSFAKVLVGSSFTNFRPTDASGAKFIYETFGFAGDNSWSASGYVEIMDERMECTESGSWTMEEARAADTATVTWVVNATDCAGRDTGAETRAQLTVDKDGRLQAMFR